MTTLWQPIESAPKDGTAILLLCHGRRVCVGFRQEVPFVGTGWFVVVPCLGGLGHGSDTFIHWPEDLPTHWQPVPEIPEGLSL